MVNNLHDRRRKQPRNSRFKSQLFTLKPIIDMSSSFYKETHFIIYSKTHIQFFKNYKLVCFSIEFKYTMVLTNTVERISNYN